MSKIETGLKKLANAQTSFSRATTEAEKRQFLAEFRSAMDWLEDTEHFEQAHQALDQAGKEINAEFGCKLRYDGAEGYVIECPVSLAHQRFGYSPDIVETSAECSICSEDPSVCDHIRGRVYDGRTCLRVVTAGHIIGISIVRRPAQPDARQTQGLLSIESIDNSLGPEFVPGTPLRCDRCVDDCTGLVELPDGVGVGHGIPDL